MRTARLVLKTTWEVAYGTVFIFFVYGGLYIFAATLLR